MCEATGTSFATELTTGTDEQAQLPYWEIREKGMSLRLVQRLPDQTRGYFMARGFTSAQSERIAQSCVFQAVFKNESHLQDPSDLEYNLRNWNVEHDGKHQGMKVREDWAKEWQQQGVSTQPKVAFEWSLYPTRQLYQPGDYNWGMSIFNLPPGTRFDLTVVWTQYGSEHRAVIRGIQCAPDIEVSPPAAQ